MRRIAVPEPLFFAEIFNQPKFLPITHHQTMLTHLFLILLTLPFLYLTFKYIKYRRNIQQAKNLGIPIAFAQFLSFEIPFLPDLFNLVSMNTLYPTVLKSFEKEKTPMVAWVDGNQGLAIQIQYVIPTFKTDFFLQRSRTR